MPITNVTIIGAGLSGLSLSLFLKKQGINSIIYELRPVDTKSPGAVMLSPNALRSLDAIGVYEKIRLQGYTFRDLTFLNNSNQVQDTYEMGNATKYTYDALRVYRQTLLDELKALVHEAEIEIIYEARFTQILSESPENVTFALKDGTHHTTSLLIGADGIHSTVRAYFYPDLVPSFSGLMAVTAHIPTSALKFPHKPYPLPASIHSKTGGAFVLAPQNPSGSEVLAGTQFQTHARAREEWDALLADKEQLLTIMRRGYEDWNPTVQSAMDAVPLHTLSIWPFYTVPKLEKWASREGRVLVLGDSAHAIPPAAGQGVNMAFEDTHSLSLVLGAVNGDRVDLGEGLEWWHEYRQGRVDRVGALTMEMNRRRVPGWAPEEGSSIDGEWLFSVDIEKDVSTWLND